MTSAEQAGIIDKQPPLGHETPELFAHYGNLTQRAASQENVALDCMRRARCDPSVAVHP
jgi:hypothetical protein